MRFYYLLKHLPKPLKHSQNQNLTKLTSLLSLNLFGSQVSHKTTTPFLPTSGEPKVACAPLHKHLQLLCAVPNPLRGWTGWGNTHIPLLIINSKKCPARSVAQQPHHTEYFPYFFHTTGWVYFYLENIFTLQAEIKTSPTWAEILTYFHFFYNRELLYTKFSHILGEQLTTDTDFYPCSLLVHTEWCRCSLISLKYTTPTQSRIFSVWERFCTALSTVLLSSVLHILRR